MAHDLTLMFAQTYRATSTFAAQVNDSGTGGGGGGRTATFFTGASSGTPIYGRVFLATAAGTGASEDLAHETLAHVEAALNSGSGGTLWRVEMTTTGYAKFTYLGTGTGLITWTSSSTNAVRILLGLSASTVPAVGTLAQNASYTAPAQPTHCAFGYAVKGGSDRGWVHDPTGWVGTEMPDGKVFGWSDGTVRFHRTLDLRFLPKDATARTALGEEATVAFPATSSWRTPTAALGTAGPWSWAQLLRTAYSDGTRQGRLCVAIGDLQTLIASGGTAFECFLTPATHTRMSAVLTMDEAPEWDQQRDWSGLELAGVAPITVAAAV